MLLFATLRSREGTAAVHSMRFLVQHGKPISNLYDYDTLTFDDFDVVSDGRGLQPNEGSGHGIQERYHAPPAHPSMR